MIYCCEAQPERLNLERRGSAPAAFSLAGFVLVLTALGCSPTAPSGPPGALVPALFASADLQKYSTELESARQFLNSRGTAWGEPGSFVPAGDGLHLYYSTPISETGTLGQRCVIVSTDGSVRIVPRR